MSNTYRIVKQLCLPCTKRGHLVWAPEGMPLAYVGGTCRKVVGALWRGTQHSLFHCLAESQVLHRTESSTSTLWPNEKLQTPSNDLKTISSTSFETSGQSCRPNGRRVLQLARNNSAEYWKQILFTVLCKRWKKTYYICRVQCAISAQTAVYAFGSAQYRWKTFQG